MKLFAEDMKCVDSSFYVETHILSRKVSEERKKVVVSERLKRPSIRRKSTRDQREDMRVR